LDLDPRIVDVLSAPLLVFAVRQESNGAGPAVASQQLAMEQISDGQVLLRQEERQSLDELFATFKCKHVYLDIGSNIGVQIRKLFEPSKYRGMDKQKVRHSGGVTSKALAIFDDVFGEPRRCDVCAIGVEPNILHVERLRTLQTRYRAAGAGVLILTRTGASTADSVTRMISPRMPQSTDGHDGKGASVSNPMVSNHLRYRSEYINMTRPPGVAEDLVSLIDTSRLIHDLRKRLSTSNPKGRILMKLDVEGLEYDIVPHLVRTQAICALHMAFLEWHPKVIAWQEHRNGLNAVGRMIRAERQVAEELSRTSHHCAVNLTDLDDETFMADGRPWPTASLCSEMGSGGVPISRAGRDKRKHA